LAWTLLNQILVATKFDERGRAGSARGRKVMLWTILVTLLVMWLLGMVGAHTLGGFLHLLLIPAITVFPIRIIQGRRPVYVIPRRLRRDV
jgi:hypothetical protein